MKFIPCEISGPIIIEPTVFGDPRGFFLENWNEREFAKAGLDHKFVQDNHSRSQAGVLRGLHFQNPIPQGKLVRVINGAIFDVVVDLRKSSSSFGKWIGVELNSDNKRLLWVPEGFAHGFLTLSDNTDVIYKCTAPYAPQHEHSLAWDDPLLAIDWPFDEIQPTVSDKDSKGLALSDVPHFA